MAGALCTTPACMNYGAYVQSLIAPANMSVDPCTDFSKFVCHGASKKFEIDEQTFSRVEDSIVQALKEVIESDYQSLPKNVSVFPKRDSSTDQTLFDKAKMGYQACMDEAAIKAKGLSPLRSVVEQITNKFSAVNHGLNATSENTGNQSMSDVLVYMQEIGVPPFTAMTAEPDPRDPDRNTISIAPAISATEGSIIRRSINIKRGEHMPQEGISQVLKALMPGNVSDDETGRLGTALTNFTATLAKIVSSPESEVDVLLGTTSLAVNDAAKLGPVFGYEKMIMALAPDFDTASNITVQSPEIVSDISKLVSKTPRNVVQAFMVLRTAETFSQDFPELAMGSPQKRQLDPWSHLAKQQAAPRSGEMPRWKQCIEHVRSSGATYALERLFVTAASVDRSKPLTENMMMAIKDQFVRSLANVTWLSADDKTQAENKTRLIVDVVGSSQSSPNQDDADDVAAFYAALNVTNDYFANILSYNGWRNKVQFSQAGKPTNRMSFDYEPSTMVNGQYIPSLNKINIYSGVMQVPFFHPDLPAYTNYGGLGTVLGHELTHGFDDMGRKYDPSGRPRIWWHNDSISAFEDRTKCFVSQYGNITIPTSDGEKPVDGSLTLGENIADAGGLHLAFDTWKSQSKADEMKIPGLERFTPEQMFYIAFATVWCGNPSPERLAEQLEGDTHSPGSARIKGGTANSKGFREAFNCPVKEPTCELW